MIFKSKGPVPFIVVMVAIIVIIAMCFALCAAFGVIDMGPDGLSGHWEFTF